jgi:fumarate reductase flavoprotein subunit
VKSSANKADQRLVRKLIEEGAMVSDWLFDMTEAAGINFTLTGYPPPPGWDPKSEWYPQYLVTHAAEGGEPLVVECIMNNALKKGVIIHFNTRAKQLHRPDNGKVTGLVAQQQSGDYIHYNANKAVILCTGDIGYNNEMMDKYAPQVQYLASKLKTSTGDGHQMAMWIGAQMEKGPGAPVTHGFFGPLGCDAFLQVNHLGERFQNEDVTGQEYTNQIERQPGQDAWQVFDAGYRTQLPSMGVGHGRVYTYRKGMQESIDELCKKTDTIDELAKLMEVPVDTLKATISRYNDLAHLGKDLDFGKRADRLFPLENPPYYACKGTYEMLVVFCGLKVNTDLQPLDAEWKIIPGLYVAGNVIGNRFAVDYPLMCPGLTHAMATTSGYIAGENAATK